MRFFAALLLMMASHSGLTAECTPGRSDLLLRPGRDAGPTRIHIQAFVNDIVAINDAEQSFTSDVFVRAQWRDPRLAHTGDTHCTMAMGTFWWPQLQMMNRRSVQNVREVPPQVMPDGTVMMVLRGFGEFGFRANLEDFPFDTQPLGFDLLSAHSDEEISFVANPEQIVLAPTLSVANFTIALAGLETRTDYLATTQREHARLVIKLTAERLTGFYTWQQLVPLFLVVLMAWIVFWIPREHVPSRIGLAATSMLTLIAYRFAMSSVLPPIAYLTRLDLFMIGASVVVFSALALAVAVTYVMDFNEALSERIHLAARYLIPLLLAGITWLSFSP